jgi:hypothetical protein
MVKYKCFKTQCPACGNTGSLQLFLNKQNEVKYARVRHYLKLDPTTKKPQFEYHKIEDLEYINAKFKYVSVNIDLNLDQTQDVIDRKLKELNPIFRNRRAGSLARLGHLLDVQKVTGSNPVRPTKIGPETFPHYLCFFGRTRK